MHRGGSCAQVAAGADRQRGGEGGDTGGNDLAAVLILLPGKERRAIQSAMKLEFCCTVGCNVEQY